MARFLDDMAVFAAVARDGSFTAAARSLGITKQSVSERIAGLEERLGVQLLIRSTRALRLTEAGERYREACVAIVARAEEADREARLTQQRAAGTVRVTAPVGLCGPVLMPAVRDLQRAHPEVSVELVLDEGLVDLVRDGLDLAIRAGSTQSTPTFIARPLFETPLALVASPAYLAASRRPTRPRDLSELNCIARGRADAWTIEGQRIALDRRISVNTFEAAREAALAELGVALVPVPIVLDDLRADRLELLFGPVGQISFTALWPARRLPVRVRLCLELLVRHARALSASVDAVLGARRASADPSSAPTRAPRA